MGAPSGDRQSAGFPDNRRRSAQAVIGESTHANALAALALQQYFGDTLISEFDAPLARNRLVRPLRAYYQWARNHGQRKEGVRCIAGHFVALKYLGYHQSTLVTWVRDPIQRMISHYHFWRSRPQNKHKSKFRTQVKTRRVTGTVLSLHRAKKRLPSVSPWLPIVSFPIRRGQ
ncbi:MAG: hypothetical protein DHS20C11_17040 [Lysobacteraceae bacterium]|nr:MAG: hypothetical protein DHS20C11_17040 [Xanthomonadaceae bacterium]